MTFRFRYESNVRKCGNHRRYHKGRRQLIQALGGKCVVCGYRWRLEFDYKDGKRMWRANECNRWVRLARYKCEAADGLIQLLCRHCNATKIRNKRTRAAKCPKS